MEPVRGGGKTNPLETANFCSKVFFCWLNSLFLIGHKRKLEEDDMYKVMPEDASERLGEELQCYWNEELQKAQRESRAPHLTKAIIRCYWKAYSILGFFTFIEESVKVIQPIFLGNVVSYFESNDPSEADLADAYINAAALSVCTLLFAVLHHLYFYHVLRAGMKLRVAMCHMIYKKALRLSNTALGQTTTGQIVNLLSNDVNKFDQVTIFLHFLWAGPLQAIAVTVLLWMEIGPSCLAGMAVLIILMPLQTCLGKFFTSFRGKTASFTDTRIRTMNEVISGMRIIKMYAWEQPFTDLVNNIRKKEISKVLQSSYLRGINLASFFVASKIIVFVTFTTYVLLGNVISASRVFVAVSLYSSVRLTVTLFFPSAIERVSEAKVSIRRIKNFLLLDEITKPALEHVEQNDDNLLVQIQDLTCYWDKTLEMPTLQNISCSVRPGELLAVIGPVGAGKSSLLSAVLGELPKDKGFVDVRGKIGYVSQQPWVFSGTVRSNILFGKEYVQEKYEKVLRVCALKKDMLQLDDGDLTVIGDRGVTLSGGQKARVNLARAVYQDADIYLLDDPLSAVDAEVGRHLFEKCICQALRKKLCILVTHQLQYLSAAKQILILKEGQMVGKGTFTELLHSGVDFASLLKSGDDEQSPTDGQVIKSSRIRTFSQSSVWSQESSVQSQKEGTSDTPPTEPVLTALPEESRSEGTVGFKVYKKYFLAGSSYLLMFVMFLLNILSQVAYVLQDWWLSYWASEQEKLNVSSTANVTETEKLDLNLYLGVYAGLTAVTIVFGVLRSLQVFHVLVCAAQALHNQMFQALLKAPVLFFDRNPIGRILNRFSKDIGHLDDLLPFTFLDFMQVGIVGRTGAGKSSLIAALFRLAEPEGKIWIDKLLTSELGLHDLRKKMSIIPQEPVLFTGTMRKNLDPFDEHTDEELWDVLKEVQLKDAIEELPGKIETQLAESGSNFSVGQRQLVCLARAILRRNRILIIDEATANVDPRTDELIQKTIREKFEDCTVLTIAHRLNTIIDNDKIMVLDSGRVKEYDEPYILLENKESLFYKMVQQVGKAEAAALTQVAKEIYLNKNQQRSPQKSSKDNEPFIIFETAL
ncbi:multidrug resistance-associated 4 [Pelobates cultripes]|uniref:Multidrug resistance-associated 4 n=1 Tax=Pelobates cultripes TaxID=61616 RepID=A0AAD1R5G2_PELCU|nr:multidrug resistance-associated 4 [Pelobates cultripes]